MSTVADEVAGAVMQWRAADSGIFCCARKVLGEDDAGGQQGARGAKWAGEGVNAVTRAVSQTGE